MLQKLTPKVTNQVKRQSMAAHPDRFIGFGSINLSKDAADVEARFEEIERLGLLGIKLLTFSQFFDPATSENFMRLCEWCEQTDRVILLHTGCGAPPWDAVGVLHREIATLTIFDQRLRNITRCRSSWHTWAHTAKMSPASGLKKH